VPEGIRESAWQISGKGENPEHHSGQSTEMQKLKTNARGIGFIATPKTDIRQCFHFPQFGAKLKKFV